MKIRIILNIDFIGLPDQDQEEKFETPTYLIVYSSQPTTATCVYPTAVTLEPARPGDKTAVPLLSPQLLKTTVQCRTEGCVLSTYTVMVWERLS